MRRPFPLAVCGLTTLALLGACSSPPDDAPTASPAPSSSSEAPEFGYEGDIGPASWASLSEEYALCSDASQQSPIDLTDATPVSVADPEFRYVTGDLELTNTTHTVQAAAQPGSTLVVDGEESQLVQFHMHEPAEHTVDGVIHDGELHLVHKDADDHITVVGILLEEGAENEALAGYFDALPEDAGTTAELTDLDPSTLLPDDLSTYRYTGSLTTPPCTEGVSWFVMEQPVEVSSEQLAKFRALIEPDARPTQERGDRELVLDGADS